MIKNPLYLVPFDFTAVAESALKLGLDLAIANDGCVVLLNVSKTKSDQSEARLRFKKKVKSLSPEEQELIETRTLVGDLYEDISKAGEILNASLIVMGTHGATGMQKIFGSRAVKMISNSDSPFLITQGKKTVDKIKTIVMPFSFEKKSIQIATFAARMAKKFNATIHLVGHHDKDELLESHTKSNLIVIRKMFDERKVEHVIAKISKDSDFDKELMEYAANVDADLMAAGYYSGGIITNPKSFIQSMIENELHVPLLTVNAEGLTKTDGHSAATGY